MPCLPGATSPGTADRLFGRVPADPESPADEARRRDRDQEIRGLLEAALKRLKGDT